ncbi:acyltransferase family protein [Lachnotalea glycerini]|uniref:acyltransferase family protein n=1 Tax=Lachnotalea glycerini TaxID=1763509 RepID=UPI00191C8B70
MGDRKNYGGLDYFKLIAAFLIVSIHTSPLTGISFNADYLLTRVIARIAVPFFLMVTGFFILPDYLFSPNRNKSVIICFVKNTLIFYAGAILLYLPIGFYAGLYRNLTFLDFFRLLVFDGTFYHLWYLPACISGVLLLCILIHFCRACILGFSLFYLSKHNLPKGCVLLQVLSMCFTLLLSF